MSVMYCEHCDRMVDTDFMDHCEWWPFKCDDCVDLLNEEENAKMQAWQYLDEDEPAINEFLEER